MQYMEFSLYDHPFRFWWPDGAANLNPLAIGDEITAASLESYILAQCSARSRRILELGTQYGLYSVLMAHALPGHGRLVGLEILPLNAQTSNENLKANGLHGKGLVLHAAVAEQDGFEPITIDVHRENASVLGPGGPIHGIGTMAVPRFTIERLQAFYGPFDMLKMDIEGFEGHILQSSGSLIREFAIAAIEIHPHMMYEVYGKSPRIFVDFFTPEDYVGFALVGNEGTWACYDLEESVFARGMTVNAFLFKRSLHEAFATHLRQAVVDGLAEIEAHTRRAA